MHTKIGKLAQIEQIRKFVLLKISFPFLHTLQSAHFSYFSRLLTFRHILKGRQTETLIKLVETWQEALNIIQSKSFTQCY